MLEGVSEAYKTSITKTLVGDIERSKAIDDRRPFIGCYSFVSG